MAKIVHIGGNPDDAPRQRRKPTPPPENPPDRDFSFLPEVQEAIDDENEPETAAKSRTTARAAVAMKLSGATYPEIAHELDYVSAASARLAVEDLLASSYDENTDYKSLRNVASARLERLMRSLAKDALDRTSPNHLAYARQFLSVVDRHIKLHGIDAPQVVTVVNPDADEFERVVGMLAQKALADAPQEADIGILEQIEDADVVEWDDEDEDTDQDG